MLYKHFVTAVPERVHKYRFVATPVTSYLGTENKSVDKEMIFFPRSLVTQAFVENEF